MNRLEQLQKALDMMGNTHTIEDILALIDAGEMQSFTEGDTWAVTQILDFPRKRVLEIFLAVGDIDDAVTLHDRVNAYAQQEGCDLIRAFGREGFLPWAKARGWRNGQRVFIKELPDGRRRTEATVDD